MIAQLLSMNADQTKVLGEVRVMVARVDERVGPLPARVDEIDQRVTSLEHDRTRAQTVVRLLGIGLAAVATAVGWLLGR